MQKNMNVYSILLFILVWMQTGNLLRAQDCQLASFKASRLYDSHFDTSGLNDSYPLGAQVRVPCQVGYVGFFKLQCLHSGWDYQGSKCQLKSCGRPDDAQAPAFRLTKGDDFIFGSEVQYTCQPGFKMTITRQCTMNGWDGAVPVCDVCKSRLGIHAYRKLVLDDQLTASSTFDSFLPSKARLDNGGCWVPATNDQHQWLQVDLRRPRTITGIITQGGGPWRSFYVKSFKVSCSDDGRTWTAVRDASGAEIFTGNTDVSTHKENEFKPPITSRFVRVMPWTWEWSIGLRMELLGCDD